MKQTEEEIDLYLQDNPDLGNQARNPSVEALVEEILIHTQPLPPSPASPTLPTLPRHEMKKKRPRLFIWIGTILLFGLLIEGAYGLLHRPRSSPQEEIPIANEVPFSEIIEPLLPPSEFEQLAPEQKT